MRHRITIEAITPTQDAYGQESGDVVSSDPAAIFVATVWGQVQDLSGAELFAASELHSQITTRITCRWRAGILPSMKALYMTGSQSRVFDILAVTDPEGRRRTLILDCKERVD
jgi:SPP1 family predicted phage head-tail adaptor